MSGGLTSASLPFHDGHAIPQVGFGLWEVDDAARVTEEGLAAGYRLIDGAAAYRNETGMGEGLRASGLPRGEVFVTTKVWNDRQGDARRAVGESLERELDAADRVLDVDEGASLAAGAVDGQRIADGGLDQEAV